MDYNKKISLAICSSHSYDPKSMYLNKNSRNIFVKYIGGIKNQDETWNDRNKKCGRFFINAKTKTYGQLFF